MGLLDCLQQTLLSTTPYHLVFKKSCHWRVELEHKAYLAVKTLNFNPKVAGKKWLL